MLSILRNSVAAVFLLSSALAAAPASAETIAGALAKAYSQQFRAEFGPRRRARHRRERADRQVRQCGRSSPASPASTTPRSSGTRLTTGSFGVEIQQTAVRRVSDQEQHADRRGAGAGLRRKPAQHRAEHPVQCGERLHGRHPRPPDRGAAGAQPRIPGGAGARRPLALRGRRGHPHRRGPGRSQPLVRRCAARRGARPGAWPAPRPITRSSARSRAS